MVVRPSSVARARLASGEPVPVLGLAARGRRDAAGRRREVAALRAGIDLGMTLLEVAPDAEDLAGEAIARRRDEVFLAARLSADHAHRGGMAAACAWTLRRLGIETLDLYLLHGRGDAPIEEVADCFESLREAGMIRHWGVAGFAMTAFTEVVTLTTGCAAAEARYDLAHRAAEWDLLDGCRRHGVLMLAYTALELRAHPRLFEVASRHSATPAQAELAWLLSHEGLSAVAPAETPRLAEELRAAAEIRLDGHDHALIADAFPPPLGPRPLDAL